MSYLNTNILGSFIGRETINKEFKDYFLQKNPEDVMTYDEIEKTIKSGKWSKNMQYLVNISLKINIDSIFPKYLSCYSNSSMNGSVMIGVSDYGEITGIPSATEITSDDVNNLLRQSFRNFVNTELSEKDIFSKIDVSVVKLSTDLHVIDDEIDELYREYKKLSREYNDAMDTFVSEKCIWLGRLSRYSRKLVDVINTTSTRNELKAFILEKSENVTDHQDLIDLLNSSEFIEIPPGEEIAILKEDKNNIIYWLTEFKDHMISNVLKDRPSKPASLTIRSLSHLLCNLSLMRHRFIANNDINYYVIIIDFNVSSVDKDVYFKFPGDDRWLYRSRSVTDSGDPCCY